MKCSFHNRRIHRVLCVVLHFLIITPFIEFIVPFHDFIYLVLVWILLRFATHTRIYVINNAISYFAVLHIYLY